MKISNLILMPIALSVDALTLGQAGMTKAVFEVDRQERIAEKIIEILKEQNHE